MRSISLVVLVVATAAIAAAVLPDAPVDPVAAATAAEPIQVPPPVTLAEARPVMAAQAAARLGRDGDSRPSAELWTLTLADGNPMLAGNAVRALGRRGELLHDDRLALLLADPRLRVRQETVLALGRSRDQAAVDRLLPLATADVELRPLVLQALGELGGGRARALVAAVAADPAAPPTEVAFARTALRAIDAPAPGQRAYR